MTRRSAIYFVPSAAVSLQSEEMEVGDDRNLAGQAGERFSHVFGRILHIAACSWNPREPVAGAGNQRCAPWQGGPAGIRHAGIRSFGRDSCDDFKQDGNIAGRGSPSSADGTDTGKPGMAVSGSQTGGGADRSFFVYGSRCAWRGPFFGSRSFPEKEGSVV